MICDCLLELWTMLSIKEQSLLDLEPEIEQGIPMEELEA